MDESGRENRRHRVDCYKVPPWNVISQYQNKEQNAFHMNAKISMLCDEKDAAIKERDRALAEKKAALDERDAAIQQRDAAIVERDNAVRERDNAIAALQFQESTMNALLTSGARGLKRTNHPTNHHTSNVQSTDILWEQCITDAFPVSAVPGEATNIRTKTNKNVKMKSRKVKKMGEDLNRQVTTDGSKAEWDAQHFGSMNQISFDESIMPVPVCSCTGVPRQCYKWGNGGWQSSCCTTSLSLYPLPQMPNKRHARMGGRKMSGSVFSRLLTRLAAGGHDLSIPVDLKNYWAKHGTNRYITIK
ncbi:hypothetical protein CDL12_13097 [Handroanthus impetiginosus]|uniref:GAGA-binding transcriptional activator n=1 Tax=Handroanthus impetiginosus TaxID=429701 RepID=A0A2G9H9T0_9LAMI|nr:hypothetical protein CDL12_13097 [Handroanthus impetiginosus]